MSLAVVHAADRPAPQFIGGTKPDQNEGAKILGSFRQANLAGQYWLALELRVLPRHGDERALQGELFGRTGPAGPETRLQIGNDRWLIVGGDAPAAWISENGAPGRKLSAEQTLQPVAGTDLTIFDLQMPFLRWTDFVYEGVADVRSRPAHRFVLYPPPELALARPDLGAVRVYLDTVYVSMVQAETLDTRGATTRSMVLLDLKKADDQWVPKSFDVRNLQTRDKTRFTVSAAALNLALPESAFAPENLALPPPPVPPKAVVKF